MITRRVRSIARRAAAGRAAPLFSAPTHAGGWIDPPVLLDRLRRRIGMPHADDDFDIELALLRLAPDNRDTTLREAGSLAGEFAAALRHALGAEGEPIGPTASLWAAAARREPPGAMTPASRNATRTAAPMPGSPRAMSSASGPRSAAGTPGLRSSSSGSRPDPPWDGAITPHPISMMIAGWPGSTARGP